MAKFIGSIFLLLAFFIGIFYVYQRQLIYFPDKVEPRPEDYYATDMSVITLRPSSNLALKSWYKSTDASQPTLLYLHGNGGHIGYRMPLVRQFINSGFGILLLEYRGYGGNKGIPTEQGLYEDGRTALGYLLQRGVKPQDIVLYGESLGTAVATKLAEENPQIGGVILQSPFTSITNLARYHYPLLPIKPWDQFNSLERVKKIASPVLVLHGKEDQLVPFNEGLTLFNQANQPKKMITFEHKGHNDLWTAPDFYQEIHQFILKLAH